MSEIFIDPSIDPKTITLRSDEVLIGAYKVDSKRPSQPLSAIQALQLLAGVDTAEDIGKRGPVVASRALSEHTEQIELHLYEAVFGRDALITARFLLDIYPELAKTTLLYLAQHQGLKHNNASEEEPGKIIHEVRSPDDLIARALTQTHGWGWPYYGSIDATPLFITLLVAYTNQHDNTFLTHSFVDRAGTNRTMLSALQAAVAWLTTKMDSNPESLLESLRLNTQGGHINQVWKDSRDAYHHANGDLANHNRGVASIEVQALAYDALLNTAELYQASENQELTQHVVDLQKKAAAIQATIWEQFWITDEDGSYFALGSDRNKDGKLRQLKVRASNMGHLLNSQLLDEAPQKQKDALVQTLTASDMLNVSGVRTLSARENRFRPNSYHNGSVWPWDTYEISLGLRRQGYEELAEDLCQRIMNVVEVTQRFPEFVSGDPEPSLTLPSRVIKVFDTQYQFANTIEQPPQEIQAWTVAAVVAI